jgi:hypothetical protein
MKKYFYLILLCCTFFTNQSKAQLADGATAPDWSLNDINGTNHNLYTYLNQGKVVVLDFSAAWCSNCWGYHSSHALEDFYKNRGPSAAKYQANVFFVESEANNNTNCLYGAAGCTGSTQGNWVAGTTHPYIDNAALKSTYNVPGYPWIYMVCPNKQIFTVGKLSATGLDAAMLSKCGITAGTGNAPLAYTTNTIVNNDCFGEAKGSISITASGGQSPYAYNWGAGKTNSTITNLAAGTYSCTITDATNAKLATNAITITEAAKIIVAAPSAKDYVACGEKGEVKISAIGGTGAFSYLWNNGATTPTLSNLTSAGDFMATITDAKGCKAVSAKATIKAFTNKAVIAGDSTGVITCVKNSVSFNPALIPGDYSFEWKDSKGIIVGNMLSQNVFTADKFVFSVRDNKSFCITTKQYEVKMDTAAPKIVFNSIAELDCNVSNAVLKPTISNGSNFVYEWEYKGAAGGQPIFSTAAVVTVTNAGLYTLTAKNNITGCESSVSKAVVAWGYPNVKMILNKPILCYGDLSAEVFVAATQGKAPYQYVWSNGIGGFSALSGLAAGDISVTVTDANKCKSIGSVKITSPEKVTLSYKVSNPTTTAAKDGYIGISTFGGVAPYNYRWTKDGAVITNTSGDLTNLGTGTYQVTVTDKNGCTATFAQPFVLKTSALHDFSSVLSYRLSPNPVTDVLYVTLSLEKRLPTTLYLSDAMGRLLSQKKDFSETEIATSFDMSGLASGVYFLMLEAEGKVVAERVVK